MTISYVAELHPNNFKSGGKVPKMYVGCSCLSWLVNSVKRAHRKENMPVLMVINQYTLRREAALFPFDSGEDYG